MLKVRKDSFAAGFLLFCILTLAILTFIFFAENFYNYRANINERASGVVSFTLKSAAEKVKSNEDLDASSALLLLPDIELDEKAVEKLFSLLNLADANISLLGLIFEDNDNASAILTELAERFSKADYGELKSNSFSEYIIELLPAETENAAEYYFNSAPYFSAMESEFFMDDGTYEEITKKLFPSVSFSSEKLDLFPPVIRYSANNVCIDISSVGGHLLRYVYDCEGTGEKTAYDACISAGKNFIYESTGKNMEAISASETGGVLYADFSDGASNTITLGIELAGGKVVLFDAYSYYGNLR